MPIIAATAHGWITVAADVLFAMLAFAALLAACAAADVLTGGLLKRAAVRAATKLRVRPRRRTEPTPDTPGTQTPGVRLRVVGGTRSNVRDAA